MSRVFSSFKAFAQGFFVGVPVCLMITDNFFTVCQVEGISMQPALNSDVNKRKDFVLLSRWKAKKYDKIKRGDIVSVISPRDPDAIFIKRIIGLEGDRIRTLGYKNQDVRIPRGHCWIEGDNHQYSLDSNSFGSVPLGLVNGVATRIVWPPSRWGQLSNQLPADRNPFDSDTELKNNETGLVVDKGDTIIEDTRASLSDSNEQDSDVNISSDPLPSSRVDNETTQSSILPAHLPQHTLRHASDKVSMDKNNK